MRRKYNSWMIIGVILVLLFGYMYLGGLKQTNGIEAKAYYSQVNSTITTTTTIPNQQNTSIVKSPPPSIKGKVAGSFVVRILDPHGNPVNKWRRAYILPSQAIYLYSGTMRIGVIDYRLYLDSSKIPEPYHYELTVYASMDGKIFYQKHFSGDYNSWTDLLLQDKVYPNNNLGALGLGKHTMKIWAIGTITHNNMQYEFRTDVVYMHLNAKAPQSIIPIDGGIYSNG